MDTFGLSLAQAYLILALVPGTGSGTGFFELPGTGFSGTDSGTGHLIVCGTFGLFCLMALAPLAFFV